jgi:hypothetical protein
MLMSATPNNRLKVQGDHGIIPGWAKPQDPGPVPIGKLSQPAHQGHGLDDIQVLGIGVEPRIAHFAQGQEFIPALLLAAKRNHDDVARPQVLVLGKIHRVQHGLDIDFDGLALHAAAGDPAQDPHPVARRPVCQPSAAGNGLHERQDRIPAKRKGSGVVQGPGHQHIALHEIGDGHGDVGFLEIAVFQDRLQPARRLVGVSSAINTRPAKPKSMDPSPATA